MTLIIQMSESRTIQTSGILQSNRLKCINENEYYYSMHTQTQNINQTHKQTTHA